MTPEPCTTQARRLRHLSTDLGPKGRQQGRAGSTLCGHDAYDEENTRWWLARWRKSGAKSFVLANLPPCKKCARAAQGSA